MYNLLTRALSCKVRGGHDHTKISDPQDLDHHRTNKQNPRSHTCTTRSSQKQSPHPLFFVLEASHPTSTQFSALSRAKPRRAQRRRKNPRNPKAGYRFALLQAINSLRVQYVLVLCCVEEVTGSCSRFLPICPIETPSPLAFCSRRQCSLHHQPPPSRAPRSKPNAQSSKPGVPAAARADRASAVVPTYNSPKPQTRRHLHKPRKRKKPAASPAAMAE
jgi:hypothetical protein